VTAGALGSALRQVMAVAPKTSADAVNECAAEARWERRPAQSGFIIAGQQHLAARIQQRLGSPTSRGLLISEACPYILTHEHHSIFTAAHSAAYLFILSACADQMTLIGQEGRCAASAFMSANISSHDPRF